MQLYCEIIILRLVSQFKKSQIYFKFFTTNTKNIMILFFCTKYFEIQSVNDMVLIECNVLETAMFFHY